MTSLAAARLPESEQPLPVVRSVDDLRAQVSAWHRDGKTVALVPTMGALHDGHLALVRRARELADQVVASVFVNPTQFAPHEDFDRYPRDEAGDSRKLASAGCHLLYAPTVRAMYPEGFATAISVGGPAEGLCGTFRPQMFGGVALVVTKLFLQAQPDVAVFGEKDYQQLMVIRRFARDLDIPVRVEGLPTVREADGLAMSSRNAYLSADERARAPELNRALRDAATALAGGAEAATALEAVRTRITAAGFGSIDYVELRDADTLVPVTRAERPARLLAAAWMGKARLIDNVPVLPA
ncbi:pantoate--beta-alanine ligase [Azospirillum argentinense]|uniref:Pantothenate synthetase n=1 Tax=Azospirillum argentinense TaxID=2970906 RepID=A0A060DFL4_9PROT|nr:pantoate--beta-alanine ligase [Azospirillum argentinense]AIB11490.1 pantoate--beta-alanine ligase [Azospirillum argentinense]EZQ08405.1 pantoate--beta-alanine ligase [Azospirillum argentinense]MBK3798848.1 pantoate--beta-alanine ligase [Azospirillum argentinense]